MVFSVMAVECSGFCGKLSNAVAALSGHQSFLTGRKSLIRNAVQMAHSASLKSTSRVVGTARSPAFGCSMKRIVKRCLPALISG